MTRFKIILPLVLALSVGGCEHLSKFKESVLTGGTSVTASIQNPVTNREVYVVMNSYAVAQKLSLAYMRRPTCSVGTTTSLTNLCAERSIKIQIANADLRVRSAVRSLRGFARDNDEVNAFTAFIVLKAAIGDFNNVLLVNGVR